MTCSVYVLLTPACKVSVTRIKPRGTVAKEYYNVHLQTRFIFVHGEPFSKSDFFERSKAIKRSESLFFFDQSESFQDLSILKSSLQKCVRRQQTDLALRCAKSLMKVNFKSFLRRLVIIAAEDVFLDENVYTVLWLYFAVQDFRPTKSRIDWLLGYVKALCMENRYDDYDDTEDVLCDVVPTDIRILLKLFVTTNTFAFEGERKMLTFIHNRGFQKKLSPFEAISQDAVPYCNVESIPLYAIDFHTQKWMIDAVHKRAKGISKETIQRLIWRCRSGVNVRKPLLHDEDDLRLFATISTYVDDVSKYILKVKIDV